MRPTDISWDLLRSFLAVLDTGSLSAAARQLDLAQPTLRRQIETLERTIGLVLFTRTPSGLSPTEAAIGLADHARTMAGTASAFMRAASGDAASDAGTVRVTCSQVIGALVMPAILVRLARRHPRIAIELAPSNTLVDVLRREADIAIRMAPPQQVALVANRVGDVEIGLYAHRAYLAQRPPIREPDDLRRGHVLIGQDRQESFIAALSAAGIALDPRDFLLRTDDDLSQYGAVRAGLGIGACQAGVAASEPDLVRILPQLRFSLPVWVVVHEDQRHAQRVRMVSNHLAADLALYARGGLPRLLDVNS